MTSRITEYYTVFVEYYGPTAKGIEAVVDPSLTRSDIIKRLCAGEWTSKTSRVLQIDHTADGLAEDVTDELIEAAEQMARAKEMA